MQKNEIKIAKQELLGKGKLRERRIIQNQG